MYKKSLALWYYTLLLIASSSMLWPGSMSDDKEKNYSTVQYQLGANTMRNYDNEEDLMRYNLHESSIKDSDVMQYAYRINFTSNNSENDDLIQYKYQTYAAKKHENHSQTSLQSRINSTDTTGKKNFMSQEMRGNLNMIKNENGSTSYDFLKNFDGYNIVPDKMCDNIVCIRLCCPFGNRLVNGKCIAQQGEFIFLETMFGYSNDSLLNESKQVDDLFLLIVDDPCQKIGHYVLNSHQNTLLVNGSLYLPYYNTIVESTSYCLAVVDYDIFVINVCFDVMEEIMNKNINYNKNTINRESVKENWMYIKDKNSSTSHDLIKNSSRDNNKNSIPDEICDNITCIRLCCPFGNRLVNGKCIAGQGNFIFLPGMFGYFNDLLRNENKSVDNLFLLVVHDPCQKIGQPFSVPFSNKNMFFVNGSLYLYWYHTIIESTSYCLAKMDEGKFYVNTCFKIKRLSVPIQTSKILIYICSYLATILFSLVIFIVYSIVPELRNIHGFILCGYSGSKVIESTVLLVKIFMEEDVMRDICIAYAFVRYYFLLTSWFWLTVMSIDIWRTFGHSLQRDVKQQERKKLILYSAYGWGGPFMLAIICGILDFVPDVSENFRPKFDKDCWFAGYITRMLCVHGIVTICIISIICLCINTARKIAHYEMDIAHHQRNLESRRYKDNKQWFNLYLKATKILFIIFCIKLPMNVLSFEVSCTVRYTLLMLDVIQQFLIFSIFVWKKKIGQLLLKRFGCQS